MNTSIMLARIMGPMMLIMGVSLLVNAEAFRAMAKDFMKSRALVYLAGFITLLLGLLVVVFHNVWAPGWPVIITVLSWVMVIVGIARMNFYERLRKIGDRMIASKQVMTGAAVVYIVLGVILSWFGYAA